jgi:hypothetical protein
VGPPDERVDLDEAELAVALDDAGPGALGGLVAPDRGDPRVERRERGAQGLHLAQLAAAVGIAFPQARAMDERLRVDGLLGADRADRHAVALLEGAPQLERLGEQHAGVEGEQVDGEAGARDQVDDHAALGPETGRERQPVAEPLRRPREDVLGRLSLEPCRGVVELFRPRKRCIRHNGYMSTA